MNTSMVVLLPEGPRMDEILAICLFRGPADDCSGWTRYASVERNELP